LILPLCSLCKGKIIYFEILSGGGGNALSVIAGSGDNLSTSAGLAPNINLIATGDGAFLISDGVATWQAILRKGAF